ncbi:glycosyltransferase family 2 protein [Aerosakkonemataceae cyanobacterium BLCC-F154]|uniref:Glycosyltransferase family 2 protein n=1 Tax=Floridaenema fluviatile BLCC-F154 TaxID=3153640 RepID=A0ABV4Y9C6_9CYAN
MSPYVSIIVNCFNQGHYLERSVKSVLEQTFTDIECIIIDDGSTDNTREVSEHLMSLDSRVKYFYKQNGGLPSARNFGVQKAEGEWIQCLDADDWIHPEKTAFQLKYITGNEIENIVFYCDYERVFIDKDENIIERQENIIGQLNSQEFLQRLMLPDFLASSPHPALQQCMLMKKDILSNHEFPKHLKALGDRYFALDIIANGVKFIYTPMVGAFYTKHKSNRTNSWKYMRDYYILFYETVKKNHEELLKFGDIPLGFLINETIMEQEETQFNRLIPLVKTPIWLLNKNLKIDNPELLKLAYKIRKITPSFILYEKYRGPRTKKVISVLSNLAIWQKPKNKKA